MKNTGWLSMFLAQPIFCNSHLGLGTSSESRLDPAKQTISGASYDCSTRMRFNRERITPGIRRQQYANKPSHKDNSMNHPDREKNIVSWWRVILTLLSVILSAGLLEPSRAKSPAGNEARVREFVAAFNARNVDAMLNLADENVQWLSIHEAKVTVET